MKRFWLALAVAIFFYTKMDILIWQRIFEANALWDLGVGSYHAGWTYALFGLMALGAVLFYPHLRRMVMFPLSLFILAFSGLEDMLYYWLDGRAIPAVLPWLNSNPLIFQPVTRTHLILSAVLWLWAVVLLEIAGELLDRKRSPMQETANHSLKTIIMRTQRTVGVWKRNVQNGVILNWIDAVGVWWINRSKESGG